jgi:aminoglycoside/choline kinase family phosphotransferase
MEMAFPAVSRVAPEDIAVTSLTGDASNRRYFRVVSKKHSLSAILMVKGVPEGFKASEEKTGRGENAPPGDPFLLIARMLSGSSLPVPEIFGGNDDGSLLLQEDLGDASLYAYLKDHPEEERSLSLSIFSSMASPLMTRLSYQGYEPFFGKKPWPFRVDCPLFLCTGTFTPETS